jgi:uncharacterized protein YkwD
VKHPALLLVGIACVALGACGGGGGGSVAAPVPFASTATGATPAPGSATPTAGPSISPAPAAAPTATATAFHTTVSGIVLQLASDAYGPITIGATTYASSDAGTGTPLAGATVVIGPVPVDGATAPAHAPAGDMLVQTTANGAFSATLDVAPAAPNASEPFVLPQNNVLGFVAPATGYYIAIFGVVSDGRTAGTAMPLHRFVSVGSALTLHVATIAAPESTALVAVNADRASAGVSALAFDTTAEEIARQHASIESANAYTCHYDAQNVGPTSRYLAAGGSGITGETLALSYGPDVASALQNAENGVLAERTTTPAGGHYLNLSDPSHVWAGIAAIAAPSAAGFFNIDEEFVTPNGSSANSASGYPTTGSCPPGIINNGS